MKKFSVVSMLVLSAVLMVSRPALATIVPPCDPSECTIIVDDCKSGGWVNRTVIIDGITYEFKNQGDCVSFAVTQYNTNVNEPALIIN